MSEQEPGGCDCSGPRLLEPPDSGGVGPGAQKDDTHSPAASHAGFRKASENSEGLELDQRHWEESNNPSI